MNRRDLIKKLTAGTIGIVASPLIFAEAVEAAPVLSHVVTNTYEKYKGFSVIKLSVDELVESIGDLEERQAMKDYYLAVINKQPANYPEKYLNKSSINGFRATKSSQMISDKT